MKPHLKFNAEHRKRPQVSFDSTRANYLLNTNSSRPGTRLSFSNLHSHQKTGVRRRPGKIHTQEITTPEREVVVTVWPPCSCLAVPVAQGGRPRGALRGAPPAFWEHPPQGHLALRLAPTSPSDRIRPPKKPSGYPRGSAPPGRPHGKKTKPPPKKNPHRGGRPKAKLRS